MHPYMAQAIAEERVADFIRVAEANRKAHDGAWPGAVRRPGWRRPSGQAREAMLREAGC